MNKRTTYILKRYLLLFAGLTIMAFGVAFSIKASLGTSPISSVPYVLSLFSPLTVGTATIAMHCVFILLQILILRKNYHPIQLMQLPVAFFFGYLTDFGVWAVQGISCHTYWQPPGGPRGDRGSGSHGGAHRQTVRQGAVQVEAGGRAERIRMTERIKMRRVDKGFYRRLLKQNV